jgi:hypothetical protein
MTARNSLRAQLWRAWKIVIKKDYNEQRINSEHGLEFYFCSALHEEFTKFNDRSGGNRGFFIEPGLSFSGKAKSRRHPDIVICDKKIIIGVIEIKYAPRGKPASKAYEKDLETLQLVANADELWLSNDRFRGIATRNTKYRLAKDAVLCWAGIYAGEEIDMQDDIGNGHFRERFLQLSALTVDGEHPNVVRS